MSRRRPARQAPPAAIPAAGVPDPREVFSPARPINPPRGASYRVKWRNWGGVDRPDDLPGRFDYEVGSVLGVGRPGVFLRPAFRRAGVYVPEIGRAHV